MSEDHEAPGYVEVAIIPGFDYPGRDTTADDENALAQTIRAVNRRQKGGGQHRPAPAVEIGVFSDSEMAVLTYLLPQRSKTLIDVVMGTKLHNHIVSFCLRALTERGVLVRNTEPVVGKILERRTQQVYTLVSNRVKIGGQEFDIAKGER